MRHRRLCVCEDHWCGIDSPLVLTHPKGATNVPDSSAQSADARTQRLLKDNIRYSNLNGIAAALAANMVSPFLGIFALKLGASNLQIGLMSSLPAFASLICAIPGGRVLDRAAHKQAAACVMVAIARVFFVVYALAPMFDGPAAPWFLVGAVALANLPGTLANVAFQSLVAEVLPPRGRARAIAARTRLVSLAGILPLLITGRLLDTLRYPVGYQIVFAAAFGIGIVEALLLLRLVEMPEDTTGTVTPALAQAHVSAAGQGPEPPAQRRGATLSEVVANREFVKFDIASFVLYLGWGMGGPLFTRYRVSYMHANNTWISVYAVVEALAAVVALFYWARLGERRGYRNVLWWCAAAVAGNVWTLAMVVDLRIGVITPIWCGIFNSGTNLMLFNSLLEIIPNNRRATFLAYHTTVINLAHLCGPMLSVLIMETMGIRWALFVGGAVRAVGGLIFLRFRPAATTPAQPPAASARAQVVA